MDLCLWSFPVSGQRCPQSHHGAVTGTQQRDLDGLVLGCFGQVTWKKQCLSPLWVGHWGMEWDLGSVLNTCPREGCGFPGVGEIHPWVEMGPPGALPSLGWDLSPKPFPALAEKGLSGVRKVISGFLGCFRDSWMKTNTGSLSLLFDD